MKDDKYNNSIIIYNQTHINEETNIEYNKTDMFDELHDMIKFHNYIPSKIKHTKRAITRIIFDKEKKILY